MHLKKQKSDNTYSREEITRKLFSLTNARREEPRALLITFYLINREKKPSIENITRVKVNISRFICLYKRRKKTRKKKRMSDET